MDISWIVMVILGAAWCVVLGYAFGYEKGAYKERCKAREQSDKERDKFDEQNRSMYDLGIKHGRSFAFAEARDLLKDKN